MIGIWGTGYVVCVCVCVFVEKKWCKRSKCQRMRRNVRYQARGLCFCEIENFYEPTRKVMKSWLCYFVCFLFFVVAVWQMMGMGILGTCGERKRTHGAPTNKHILCVQFFNFLHCFFFFFAFQRKSTTVTMTESVSWAFIYNLVRRIMKVSSSTREIYEVELFLSFLREIMGALR